MVREVPVPEPPALVHPAWAERLPWLSQGTTVRGHGPESFDLGIFSDASPPRSVLGNWERLRTGTGFPRVVHAHQIHGATVRVHDAGPPGLHLAEACDGHATAVPGTLLAVTVADCVPVSVVDPERRAVALLHAGWRGVAAGILERGLAVLGECAGSTASDVLVHLGPAICGGCYQVGSEVFRALGLPEPAAPAPVNLRAAPAPVDLRAALAHRAVAAGVRSESISVSAHCTLCGGPGLLSHRGGDRGRQVGFLGLRPVSGAGPEHPEPGLCVTCRHRRLVESRRGSRFTLCRLSETDRRYPRYPKLPVLQCDGYRGWGPAPSGRGDGAAARDS